MSYKDFMFFFGVAMMIVGLVHFKETPGLSALEITLGGFLAGVMLKQISQRPKPKCCGEEMTFHRSQRDSTYKCRTCGRFE